PTRRSHPGGDREAGRAHGEDDGDVVVEVGQDREDQSEDETQHPAEYGAEEVLVGELGDDAGTEGEPGEEAPDGDHETQYELPCDEHGAPGDDREEAQDDVGHGSNVGLAGSLTREDAPRRF